MIFLYSRPGGTQKYEPPVMIQGYRLEQDNTGKTQ